MRNKMTRLVMIAGAAILAAGIGPAAFAGPGDPIDPGSDGVVTLDIDLQDDGDGALWMTVADDQETLVEDPAQASGGVRVFEGTLPTVTVTDTRTGSDVPEEGEVWWYVTGEVGDFTHDDGAHVIYGHQLGWTPAMTVDPGGDVEAGDPVDSTVDDPAAGLQGGSDLLVWTWDSNPANPFGTWSAQAGLTLKTSGPVYPGHYAADLTLTLMEDPY
ncbi:MAG: hypothetical protein LBD97_09545 [Bifidobacteriaceae bacterium]|jgi:hypothetical protein|nr:hypothetical protein [Bifidobacteriaceae bacterium]